MRKQDTPNHSTTAKAATTFFGPEKNNHFFGQTSTAAPSFFQPASATTTGSTIQRTPSAGPQQAPPAAAQPVTAQQSSAGAPQTTAPQPSAGSPQATSGTQQASTCPGKRDPGEIAMSQSPNGVLSTDTTFDSNKETILLQDFAIDQDTITPSMTQSDDWRRMMSMIVGDPTASVAVLGYSDCIGSEKNNQNLRNRRANAIINAMPAEAQARINPLLRGWWGQLEYQFPNDTAQNRARNRMVRVVLLRGGASACDSLPKATNIDQYIYLVSCLEKRLGLTGPNDTPKTLSVLRQLYFGNAAWSNAGNRSKIWDDIIPSRPWTPGTDPTPQLGPKLYNALLASKDIKYDNSPGSIGIDISHLLTGLDAMRDPVNPAIHASSRFSIQTNTMNHELATWAGDVASAAANYTICIDFLKFTAASYPDFFKDLAGDADLEGNIDAYAVWAAQNSAPGAPVPLQLNIPFSEILMQYYRLKKGAGGQARTQRFEVFANFYGANVKGGKMLNRAGFQQNIYPAVSEIAMLLFAKQMKEIMQGNGNSIGNCAGGTPPVQNGQPGSVDLVNLMAGVAISSAEMTELFTRWIEKRL